MKTFKQIKQVNHNDISFFLGIPVIDAKFLIKCKIFPLSQSKGEKVSIGIKDYVDVNLIEKPIHANSKLDGKGMIETVVNTYNKGVTPHRFMEFGQNPVFINAIKFTGKSTIANEILNTEQYEKLQRIWLFSNVYDKKRFSKNAATFIRTNEWAKEYLESRGIQDIDEQVSKTLDTKKELINT